MIEIQNKADCCGCTACYNICPKNCISMQYDNEGFRYPIVDTNKCINCNLCVKVCPIINHTNQEKHPQVYGVINKNKNILETSTSGGVFLSLAKFIIEQQGIVVGVTYDKDLNVKHQFAETLEACREFQKSKYVESQIPLTLFKDIQTQLNQNKVVLFTGTPCQVSGLKSFLRKPYPNLYLCDLICSSVPSSKIFHDYLAFIQRKNKKRIKSLIMRWKGNGWNNVTQQLTYEDGTVSTGTEDAKLWYTIAFSHLVSRPSCHECRYTNFNRPGDITIGDFWGIEKAHPDFFDNQGVSLALINTEKGEQIFNSVHQNFRVQPSTIESCKQARLQTPVNKNPRRDMFWQEYSSDKFEHLAKKYWRFGAVAKYRFKIRRFLGKVLRKLQKK